MKALRTQSPSGTFFSWKWRGANLATTMLFAFFVFFANLSLFAQSSPSKAERNMRRAGQAPAAQALNGAKVLPSLPHGKADLKTQAATAAQSIPWQQLSVENRAKVKKVVSDYTIFRHLPTQMVLADPLFFGFFLEHPDIIVGMWEELGAADLTLTEQSENRYFMTESVGTTAVIDVVYKSPSLYVLFVKGQYQGPMLSKFLEGTSVLILRNRYAQDQQGEPLVICDIDVFVQVDNVGADLLVKLFASQVGKIADGNFEQTASFLSHVAEATRQNPSGVQRVGQRLRRVSPHVRAAFCEQVSQSAQRAWQREEGRLTEKSAKPTLMPQEMERPPVVSQNALEVNRALPIPILRLPASTAAVSLHEKTITDEKSDSEFGQAVRSVTETTVEATVTEDTAAEEPEWSLPQLQGRVIFGTPNLDG